MAQWARQYMGLSHATMVEDLENDLRHAVEMLNAADSDEDRQKNAKAVHKLSERLLAARLKLFRARIRDLEPVSDAETYEEKLLSLRRKESETGSRRSGDAPSRVWG